MALAAAPPQYPDHRTLLVWRDEQGREHPVKSTEDWKRRREHILAGMQEAMGPLPNRAKLPPLDAQISEDVKLPGLTRLTLTFAADKRPDGVIDRVPAYLFLPSPQGDQRRPAMLALHQTTPIGKGEPAGVGGKSNLHYAAELAHRGYVVLVPDYPSFGDYRYDFATDAYDSGTMKGIVNHMRAVDLLAARPEVDPERIGVIGHSLGGHNALFVAAFDERLKVVVTSCGWTPFHDYYGGKIDGWTSDRYMPRLRDAYRLDPNRVPFDFYEVLGAIAPRAIYSNSPLRDDNFAVEGVRKAEREARKVFDLHKASDWLRVVYPDCGHDFPPEVRMGAYEFIDRVLAHTPPADAKAAVQPPRATDFADQLPRVSAREPREALAALKVAPGYRVELVAAEPLVASPVALAFDENARMFVVEMRDYPESPEARLGRVRLLEDVDGDGAYERSSVFADGLSWPTGITCYDGGVLVTAAPDVLYIKDTDGDGRADRREVVFTGFGRDNVQGLLNSLAWGLDNRIHGATGTCGARVARPDAKDLPPLVLQGRDFSFEPRSRRLRPESGGGQHGMTFDDWGRKFVCSNSDHCQAVMLADRYLARNPLVEAPPARISIAADGPQAEVFRASPVEAWRVLRTKLRVAGVVPGPIEGGGRPAGYFTGATGITIYRGDAWPASDRSLALIGDVGSNLVHRKRLLPDGVGWRAERIDKQSEFVASQDIWFRPVGFANAPDGTLHLIDMCREVIEHPLSLPPDIKRHLDLASGRERGRIWRIVPDGFKPRPPAKLFGLSSAELVGMLAHANGWHRDTASRLLYERQDRTALPLLREMAARSASPLGRMHALWALEGLGALRADELLQAVSDAEPRVREHAIRLGERLAADSPALRTKLLAMTDDPDLRVRWQLAFSLGELADPSRLAALAQLVRKDGNDRWMRAAVLSSLNQGAGDVFRRLSGDPPAAAGQAEMLVALARQTGMQQHTADVAAVLESLGKMPAASAGTGEAIVRGLAEGFARARRLLPPALLAPDGPGKLLTEMIDNARAAVADDKLPVARRADAARTLGLLGFNESGPLLAALLDAKHPHELQLAVLATLGGYADGAAGEAIVRAWSGISARARGAALDVLLSRPAWVEAALQAVERGALAPVDIDPTHARQFALHSDPALRARAARLLAAQLPARRAEVVQKYQNVLQLQGDASRGKAVFRKHCVACHKLDGAGYEVGPNLATIKNRGPDTILTAVLDPNREVNPQYVTYQVVTHDGRTLAGMLSAESATSLTLARGESATDTVLRADVEQLRSTGLSLMAEGIEREIDQQSMADLIGYLMASGR